MKIEINNGTLKVNDQVILYDDEEKVDTNHTEDLKKLVNIIKKLNYKQWQIISYLIECEYKRVANKNVPEDTETLLENILQEIN